MCIIPLSCECCTRTLVKISETAIASASRLRLWKDKETGINIRRRCCSFRHCIHMSKPNRIVLGNRMRQRNGGKSGICCISRSTFFNNCDGLRAFCKDQEKWVQVSGYGGQARQICGGPYVHKWTILHNTVKQLVTLGSWSSKIDTRL